MLVRPNKKTNNQISKQWRNEERKRKGETAEARVGPEQANEGRKERASEQHASKQAHTQRVGGGKEERASGKMVPLVSNGDLLTPPLVLLTLCAYSGALFDRTTPSIVCRILPHCDIWWQSLHVLYQAAAIVSFLWWLHRSSLIFTVSMQSKLAFSVCDKYSSRALIWIEKRGAAPKRCIKK